MPLNTWIEVDGCGAMPVSLLTSQERLTITTQNLIPPVQFTPADGMFMLTVNATTYTPEDGSFAVSGKNITWTSSFLSVLPGDVVVAIYSYEG